MFRYLLIQIPFPNILCSCSPDPHFLYRLQSSTTLNNKNGSILSISKATRRLQERKRKVPMTYGYGDVRAAMMHRRLDDVLLLRLLFYNERFFSISLSLSLSLSLSPSLTPLSYFWLALLSLFDRDRNLNLSFEQHIT